LILKLIPKRRLLAGAAAALALLAIGVASVAGGASADTAKVGALSTATAPSAALGGSIDYTVYLPYGYGSKGNAAMRYPVLTERRSGGRS
jgi:hypothetical protein